MKGDFFLGPAGDGRKAKFDVKSVHELSAVGRPFRSAAATAHRHKTIKGRRERDIQAAIFNRRGRALELEPESVAQTPMCCPSCAKAGIRLTRDG